MTELPEVVVKRGKMFSYWSGWSGKTKAVALLLLILIYVYVLFFVKLIYMKSKRLDRVLTMVSETEKQILEVHAMDQNLAVKMQQIEDFLQAY